MMRPSIPLALQLGGADPLELAAAARIGAAAGFDEINLNVGCPSDRVRSGSFGACLMLRPALVAECVERMRESTQLPVTVKCRIGVDARDDYGFFSEFAAAVARAGVAALIVHARAAILAGLSPKENREIPPLKYDYVHRLKRDHPDLPIVLNGGMAELERRERAPRGRLWTASCWDERAYHRPALLGRARAGADRSRLARSGAVADRGAPGALMRVPKSAARRALCTRSRGTCMA